MAVARESWGPDCSLISRPHQRASFAASTQAGRTQHYAQVSKGLPIDAGQSLAVLSMKGSEPHGSAGLRKPVPRAFSFSCLFFFFFVFIYFRYSINAICTAQVRSCQHFPLGCYFQGTVI